MQPYSKYECRAGSPLRFPVLVGNGLERIAVFKNRISQSLDLAARRRRSSGKNEYFYGLASREWQVFQDQLATLDDSSFYPVRFHALSIEDLAALGLCPRPQ